MSDIIQEYKKVCGL